MELKVLTRREKTSPQGKPRVYFSCHPADFETAFPMIPKDILDQANCAVWYDPDPAAAVDAEELEAVLNEMQLVVFPVTSRFLREENRARNAEFPLAMKNHIPILPILLENDLGYEFIDTCAPIQAVTREVTDPTATPYETVLKTFLNSVLIGEKLAEKVRSLGAVGINTHYSNCRPAMVKAFHEQGMPVSVWTVNDEKNAAKYASLGVDNITTRKPDLFREG